MRSAASASEAEGAPLDVRDRLQIGANVKVIRALKEIDSSCTGRFIFSSNSHLVAQQTNAHQTAWLIRVSGIIGHKFGA